MECAHKPKDEEEICPPPIHGKAYNRLSEVPFSISRATSLVISFHPCMVLKWIGTQTEQFCSHQFRNEEFFLVLGD